MKTADLQKTLLGEIERGLENGDVPLTRIRALARQAIALSEQFPDDIPPEWMKKLIVEFPEITLSMRDPLRKESQTADKETMEEIRRTLGLEN